jgi:hypothetical protein
VKCELVSGKWLFSPSLVNKRLALGSMLLCESCAIGPDFLVWCYGSARICALQLARRILWCLNYSTGNSEPFLSVPDLWNRQLPKLSVVRLERRDL